MLLPILKKSEQFWPPFLLEMENTFVNSVAISIDPSLGQSALVKISYLVINCNGG